MTDFIEQSIVPKSDQLNADDLLTGSIRVTVAEVKQGSTAEQPVVIKIDGGRQPYKPCKSMRRLLVHCWGTNGTDWVGRQMVLFCDPTVKWAGSEVGGIRISHLSHIGQRQTVQLTVTRGKKKPWKRRATGSRAARKAGRAC